MLLLFASALYVTAIGQMDQAEDNQGKLDSIRNRIKDLQTEINVAKSDADVYQQELQQNEMAIVESRKLLETVEGRIREQLTQLDSLRAESVEQEKFLRSERELLADQIRMAYKTGRHDALKLLLNQEDPGLIGRMMTFHDYYNRARADRISEIRITLQNLASIKTAIDLETEELKQLRNEQLKNLDELQSYHESRTAIISKLESYISTRDKELQNLQRNEQELAELIENLGKQESVTDLYQQLPPFTSLKGKLRWPVNGSIVSRYGSEKKGGKLRWNGVRISAEAGEHVTAVSAGRIVFADWFRNLGLLIIIDHGGGYMSLYGHNERLLKKAGDFVSEGEQIARVGDTGGQGEIALYFEIRQQGNPINPDLWCRS